jgi:Rod binding domain-containing protein
MSLGPLPFALSGPLALSGPSGLAGRAPPSLGPVADERAARTAAEDFETFFLARAFETMGSGVSDDSPFSGGPGESAWRGLLNDAFAAAAVRSGGVGLADRLTKDILALQAAETAP